MSAIEFDPEVKPVKPVAVDPNEGLDPSVVASAQKTNPMAEILRHGIAATNRLERKVLDITGQVRDINSSLRDLIELQKLLPREPEADVQVTEQMRALRDRLAAKGIDLFPADAQTVSAEWVKKFQTTLSSQIADNLKTDLQLFFHDMQDKLQKSSSLMETLKNLNRSWERFIEKLIDNGMRR